jgi:predicted MFS family arabinose efflux permease
MTASRAEAGPSSGLIFAFAISCGVIVANLYYVQPLVGPIGDSLQISVEIAALLVTTLQLGYVAGLLFLAPLGDIVENRRLILLTLAGVVASCALAAASPSATVFIVACLLIGSSAAVAQMLIPLAAHLSPADIRGRVVGTVMSGLLIGILLARPLSTLVAGLIGWRGMFGLSAAATAAVIAMLAVMLPTHRPETKLHYGTLVGSLWPLLRDTRPLQRRGFYQACLFGAFSLYWTAMPLVLTQPPFSFGHVELSLFLLTGAAGAFVAPLAGSLADRGYGAASTALAFALVASGFVLAYAGRNGAVPVLVIGGILLDAGVQGNVVIGQRVIYALAPHIRSRLNALYLAIFFCGGAAGSALTGWAFAHGGLPLICALGVAFPLLAALVFATEFVGKRRAR